LDPNEKNLGIKNSQRALNYQITLKKLIKLGIFSKRGGSLILPKIKTNFFSDSSKTITNHLKKENMTEAAQMDNYFLSYPEKYQEYDPDNAQYKAAIESAKNLFKKFPKIKVISKKR